MPAVGLGQFGAAENRDAAGLGRLFQKSFCPKSIKPGDDISGITHQHFSPNPINQDKS
jgi:hypothetical protein